MNYIKTFCFFTAVITFAFPLYSAKKDRSISINRKEMHLVVSLSQENELVIEGSHNKTLLATVTQVLPAGFTYLLDEKSGKKGSATIDLLVLHPETGGEKAVSLTKYIYEVADKYIHPYISQQAIEAIKKKLTTKNGVQSLYDALKLFKTSQGVLSEKTAGTILDVLRKSIKPGKPSKELFEQYMTSIKSIGA